MGVGRATAAEVMCVCCFYGNRSRVPQKSECSKYKSVHRDPPQKISDVYILGIGCIDQMLGKSACPKIDVECVRHSGKRDL